MPRTRSQRSTPPGADDPLGPPRPHRLVVVDRSPAEIRGLLERFVPSADPPGAGPVASRAVVRALSPLVVEVELDAGRELAVSGGPDSDSLVEELSACLGDDLVSTQGESLSSVVVGLLEAADLRMAVAESLTGGLLSHVVCEVPGAGDRMVGGVVAYSRAAKHTLLAVPDGPVVSADAAAAMAAGVARLLDAPAAVAVTGVAGPAEQDGQPVGSVFVASAVDGDVRTRHRQIEGDRQQIEGAAVDAGLDELRRHLLGTPRVRASA